MSDRYGEGWGSIRRVMIVGCGRLGSAFAEGLSSVGIKVLPVSARRPFSASDLRAKLSLETSYPSIQDVVSDCDVDLILLTVPDDAIAIVAEEVRDAGLLHPGMLVAHPSGSQPAEAIASCRRAGAITASLHPLQTFPRGIGDGARFHGITFAFDGEAGALPPLRELAFRLGADLFEIPADRKAEYHTAAVMASNCLVGLLHVAVELFREVGSLPGESLRRLRPLINATLDNLEDLGPVGALTGPVSRGDAQTIARQIAVLQRHLPENLALYRELSLCLLGLAKQRSEVDPALLAEVEHILQQARCAT